MKAHTCRAGTLTNKRYFSWITAECSYIIRDPLDGHVLIQETHITRRILMVQKQKPEYRHAVVQANEDNLGLSNNRFGIIDLER